MSDKDSKEMLLEDVENYLLSFVKTKNDQEKAQDILNAIKYVDREFYVKDHPYIDSAIPIGNGQTISQPSTVARMLMLANLKAKEKVLELGAGSGWSASLIGYIIYPGQVLSLDIISDLILKAKKNRANLQRNVNMGIKRRLEHIEFREENILTKLDTWEEKYDKIIITAGIRQEQKDLIYKLANELLNNKGKLICPTTKGPIIIFEKINGEMKYDYTKEEYQFVPLL